MANHSPATDNYVVKKTWEEAISGEAASGDYQSIATPTDDKGEAARNGGGDDRKTSKK